MNFDKFRGVKETYGKITFFSLLILRTLAKLYSSFLWVRFDLLKASESFMLNIKPPYPVVVKPNCFHFVTLSQSILL